MPFIELSRLGLALRHAQMAGALALGEDPEDDAHDDFVDAASCAYHGLSFGSGPSVASAGKSVLRDILDGEADIFGRWRSGYGM